MEPPACATPARAGFLGDTHGHNTVHGNMGNMAGTVVDSGVSLEDGIVTDIKALLREVAEEIRASVEAAAESLGEPVRETENKFN